MRPFLIIIPEILRYFFLPRPQIPGNPVQAFLLDSPVKSLQMSIVIRRPYPGMPMGHASFHNPFGKPFGKLRTMVGLDSLKTERRGYLRRLNKTQALMSIDPQTGLSVGKAGADIQGGIDTKAIRGHSIQNRVYFEPEPRAWPA